MGILSLGQRLESHLAIDNPTAPIQSISNDYLGKVLHSTERNLESFEDNDNEGLKHDPTCELPSKGVRR